MVVTKQYSKEPEGNCLLPTEGREPSQPLAVGGRLGTSIAHLTLFPLQEYRRISWKNQSPSDGMSLPICWLLNIPGWESWDYQNWRDFAAAMREDKPIEYAMCVWLMQQESTDQAFQDGEWSVWYHYARKHCPRFDREQPRRR